MNDSPPPPPLPEPRPFAPAPVGGGGGGCQKPLLIGCGLLALLLGIGAVVFVVKAKDVLAYAMDQLRTQVVARLPADAPAIDRQRVDEGFDAALARIRSGELDPAALQELQKKLTAAASAAAARTLTRDELDGLVAALDKFNGRTGEPTGEDAPDGAPAAGAAGETAAGENSGTSRPPAP